ncbi:recombinase family protein [Burkholderia territorii]|uniref:recombinase family protein n=1 Tax=Burkholderia territorii TaxID=1503055 RepID=UPI0009BFC30F|nr:recombinase family protein [Burkholderia territorii]
MKIGYARVSTVEQNLGHQRNALENYGCDRVTTDQGISGVRFGLRESLELAQPEDTIVVWRLDRLGRSLRHLVELMNELRARDIHFASLNESIDTSTLAGTFMSHMTAALAEFERALIGHRTCAGLGAVRSRGQRSGHPQVLDYHQVQCTRDLLKTHSEVYVAAHFNVHPRTLRQLVQSSVVE